ncbi:hypothetical protein EVAR_69999_1 [Eumeta japonica]|uniref:Uncharacterized protein n=1 Tax=Eumeta variegata TaxID=151549 RepID=A0A4C2A627_EUMVA|nr:hypothetical protein EVAR_69999_1 [Eumeta japonica]
MGDATSMVIRRHRKNAISIFNTVTMKELLTNFFLSPDRRSKIGIESGIEIESGTGAGPDNGITVGIGT